MQTFLIVSCLSESSKFNTNKWLKEFSDVARIGKRVVTKLSSEL